MEECGSKNMLNNELRTRNKFITKYYGEVVDWEGYFSGRTTFNVDGERYENVFIKMDPTDSNEDSPDISLRVVSNGRAKSPDLKLLWDQDVKVGQPIKFNAKVMKLGDDDNPHLFQLFKANYSLDSEARDLKAFPVYKFKNAKFLRHGDGAAMKTGEDKSASGS